MNSCIVTRICLVLSLFLKCSDLHRLGESSADIPVGFGAFVNLKPTRMSAIQRTTMAGNLGESNADIPVGFGAICNLALCALCALCG